MGKVIILVTIIIGAAILGGFLYIIETRKQQFIERQQQVKIDHEKQKQLYEEITEQTSKEIEEQLSDCIFNAEESYLIQWYTECNKLGKVPAKCIDVEEINFNKYMEKYDLTLKEYNEERGLVVTGDITEDYFTAFSDHLKRIDSDCSCGLPSYLGDGIIKSLQKNRDLCLEKYK